MPLFWLTLSQCPTKAFNSYCLSLLAPCLCPGWPKGSGVWQAYDWSKLQHGVWPTPLLTHYSLLAWPTQSSSGLALIMLPCLTNTTILSPPCDHPDVRLNRSQMTCLLHTLGLITSSWWRIIDFDWGKLVRRESIGHPLRQLRHASIVKLWDKIIKT